MIAECQCQWCDGHIEFDPADFVESGVGADKTFGQKVPCPHCGKETILYLNKSPNQTQPRMENLNPLTKTRRLPWIVAVAILAVLIPALISFLWKSGMSVEQVATGGASMFGIAIACVLGGIFILFVLTYIVEILTLLFLCVGLFLIVNGIVDMVAVNSALGETVFHQIYALLEFVGGALVFCAAMILHLLRSRLNPEAKASPTVQSGKGTP